MSKVVCPPYDVIDAKGQEEFYQKHPYNFIRLILGRELAGDTDSENKYTRSAGYLEEWLRRGILVQDDQPAVYFYEQDFLSPEGQTRRRLGFIALMRLEDEAGAAAVYPHEHTHTAPKEDRLRVMKSVEANLSPIFTVFSDPRGVVGGLFDSAVAKTAPLFSATDTDGGANKLWRMTDPGLIGKLKAFLSDKDVFIADGHHRFEVAKMFRDFKKSLGPGHFKDSYNTIMTYFTPLEDKGLVILPTHRLIKDASFSPDALAPLFGVKELPDRAALAAEMKKHKDKVGAFGLYKQGKYYFFRIADKAGCNRLVQDAPQAYKDLDVAILHKVVFDHILKIALPQISYEVRMDRAIEAVDSGVYDALFLLNATKIGQIRDIALGGEVMPQKSTYFYPKLLSGLVIHKF